MINIELNAVCRISRRSLPPESSQISNEEGASTVYGLEGPEQVLLERGQSRRLSSKCSALKWTPLARLASNVLRQLLERITMHNFAL